MIYCAYGLTFYSDIPISALTPASPDSTSSHTLRIELGGTPEWAIRALSLPPKTVPLGRARMIDKDSKFTFTELGGDEFFLLQYADGTRFVVNKPATLVWGEFGPGLTNEDLFVYLLGPVMGFVLRRRGRLALHASAVTIGGHAVALVGGAGTGKSTTAAALALRGWPVVCEDICSFDESEGRIHVLPGYPRVCLWPDSVGFLFSSSDALPLVVSGWEKRFLALDGSQAKFASRSAPLLAIYLLSSRSADDSAPRIEFLPQKDVALALVQNTYMNYLLDRNQRASEFDAIARTLSAVECFQLTPSADHMRLPAMAALIESHAASLADGRAPVLTRSKP